MVFTLGYEAALDGRREAVYLLADDDTGGASGAGGAALRYERQPDHQMVARSGLCSEAPGRAGCELFPPVEIIDRPMHHDDRAAAGPVLGVFRQGFR